MKPSTKGLVAAGLPNVSFVVLFYSLVIHMRLSLGGWPTSIGDRGFPEPLIVHEHIVLYLFEALFLLAISALPFGILLSLLVARWRRFAPYLALYVMFYGITWGLVLLAPAPFLDWWWD